MISGLLLASLLSVPVPRIVMVGSLFMAPEELITESPGTTPCKAFDTSDCGRASRDLLTSTVDTAPVKLAFSAYHNLRLPLHPIILYLLSILFSLF